MILSKRKLNEISQNDEQAQEKAFWLYEYDLKSHNKKYKTCVFREIDSKFIAAARSGNIEGVRQNLRMGANVNSYTESLHTALLWAVRKGHKEIVSLLIENGADLEFGSQTAPHSPLSAAAKRGDVEVVDILLKNGAEINRITKNPWASSDRYTCALTVAVQWGSISVVELLIKNGANLNPPRCENILLTAARGKGSKKLMSLLVEYGVNNPFPYDKTRFTKRSHADRFLEELTTILRPIDKIIRQFDLFYHLDLGDMQIDRKNLLQPFLRRKDLLPACLFDGQHLDRFALIFFRHLLNIRNIGQALNRTILDCNPAFAYGQALSKLPDELIVNVAQHLPDYCRKNKKNEALLFSGARLERARQVSVDNMISPNTCQVNKQQRKRS